MQPVEHIGKRMRLYRKQKKMTINDLSSKLHLSPSTISKYENGKIAMDVSTLFYIASVLDIDIHKLVDYAEPSKPTTLNSSDNNFFKHSNIYYIYRYYGMERRIGIDVLEIIPYTDASYDKVMLYHMCSNESDYTKCSKLFSGNIYYIEHGTTIYANSTINEFDTICMHFRKSIDNKTSYGIITGHSDIFNKPYSAKILASPDVLEHNKELKLLLKVNDKASINQIKETNAFFAE